MRYLIISGAEEKAFFTNWYQFENHWSPSLVCVIDTHTDRVTFDGETWQEIEEDHL